MSKKMVETIKKTISECYYLQREDRNWFLENNVRLRVPNKNSLGFSLDNKQKPPFAFFNDKPPLHVAKMCDAILALSSREKFYLFIIEQKTSNLDQYEKQLANGKYFCDWLFSLYKEHGHYLADPVYIRLLIWQPRPLPRKGTTSHHSKDKPKKYSQSDYFLEERNNQDIYLQEIIKRCK